MILIPGVIAGADCGFGTFAASTPTVFPSIVWEKLRVLSEGAAMVDKGLGYGDYRRIRIMRPRNVARSDDCCRSEDMHFLVVKKI